MRGPVRVEGTALGEFDLREPGGRGPAAGGDEAASQQDRGRLANKTNLVLHDHNL